MIEPSISHCPRIERVEPGMGPDYQLGDILMEVGGKWKYVLIGGGRDTLRAYIIPAFGTMDLPRSHADQYVKVGKWDFKRNKEIENET